MREHTDLLGRKAVDKVTGFSGVVSSVSYDLYGCVQVVLTPPVNKDGKIEDGRWLDINRLEIDKRAPRVMPVPVFPTTAADVSGPAEKPIR
jgi:hypothetical protein